MTEPAPFIPVVDPRILRLVFLGGVGRFGMNMLAVLYEGRLFVVDCGQRFADRPLLGVEAAIPDVDVWFKQAGGVYAYLITHGHEDHIGALPHLYRKWPAPVYALPWAAELLKEKFRRHGWPEGTPQIVPVSGQDTVSIGNFSARFLPVTHSIPLAASLLIRTAAGSVFHTGDFKIDGSPELGEGMDLVSFCADVRRDGAVDLMLTDSTNADRAGWCPSESSVRQPLETVLRQARGAVVVSTFSSNLERIKTIVEASIAVGRAVYLAGSGLEASLAISDRLGIWRLPGASRLNEDQLKTTPREHVTVIATGCQGESRSALYRMAAGEYRQFPLNAGDTVVLSSRVIPGNESSVIYLTEALVDLGVKVVTPREVPGLHVSGHAFADEVEGLLAGIGPKFHAPVHGGHSFLSRANRISPTTGKLARTLRTGDIVDLIDGDPRITGTIPVEELWIDSESLVPMTYPKLRERLRIGELGAAILTGVCSSRSGAWLNGPEIDLIGLPLPETVVLDRWRTEISAKVAGLIRSTLPPGISRQDHLNEEARILLRRSLHAMLKKKPVVIARLVVLDVGSLI